jgi:hypothetical protein
MNTYQYEVTLKVEIEAFDESDAWDAVQDAFGAGSQPGINVIECEYKEAKARKR